MFDVFYWFTPIIITKYTYSDKLSFAARAKYYQGKNQVIQTTDTPHGFRHTVILLTLITNYLITLL